MIIRTLVYAGALSLLAGYAHAAAMPPVPLLPAATIALSFNEINDLYGAKAKAPSPATPAGPGRAPKDAEPGTLPSGLMALDGVVEWKGEGVTAIPSLTKRYLLSPEAHTAISRDEAALREVAQSVAQTIEAIRIETVQKKVPLPVIDESVPPEKLAALRRQYAEAIATNEKLTVDFGKEYLRLTNEKREITLFKLKPEWLDADIPPSVIGQIDKLIDYGPAPGAAK